MINLDKWQKEILETKGNILLCSGRQVGKSTIISIASSDYACKNEKKSVLIISATERQAEELFIKCLFYIQDNYKSILAKGKDRPTKHILKLKNGSIIRCLPTGLSGTGIRGFTIHRLIVDEAAFIPEEVWAAVTPMLLTTAGDIILVSTPHGKVGYFWDCYNNKDFKIFHINSEQTIKEREISDTWTLHQRERALAFLDEEKKRMSSLQYAQEYMGEFIDELRQYFSDKLIKECCVLKRPDGISEERTYFLGVDIARMGNDSSSFEILDGTEREKIKQIESITTKKTLTTETEKKILDLDKSYNFKAIAIDAGAGSLGVSVYDHLLNDSQVKNKIVAINNRARSLDREETRKVRLMKEDLYDNLRALMERGEIQLLDDDDLILCLKSVQYEYVLKEGQPTKMRIFAYPSADIVEGIIRAAWEAKEKHLNLFVYYS